MLLPDRTGGVAGALCRCVEVWFAVCALMGHESARAAGAGLAAGSPSEYVWTLEYRIWTKPGDERVTAHGVEHNIKYCCTAVVRDIRVKSDGTFAFDGSECAVIRQEQDTLDREGKPAYRFVSQWLGMLRGTGRWEGGGKSMDESVQLRLEYAGGNGETATFGPNGERISVARFTASPDGRTHTTAGPTTQGKSSDLEYPNSWQVSDWTLRASPGASAGPGHARPRGRGPIMPPSLAGPAVSLLAADYGGCDETEHRREGQRPRKTLCPGGVETVLQERVKLTGAKKQADLAVSFGGDVSYPQPGSSGSVEAVVSNHGPCETHATLKVNVIAGDITDDDFATSHVRVLRYSGGASEVTVSLTDRFDDYNFTYQFTLPSGGRRAVKIEAQDATPPGQTRPYLIHFRANVTGDLPDPNGGNNFVERTANFHPRMEPAAKPAPSKPK